MAVNSDESKDGTDLCGFADLSWIGSGGGGGSMYRLAMVASSGPLCYVFKIVNSSPPAFVLHASPGGVGSFGICAADLNSDHKTDLPFGAPAWDVRWIKQTSFDMFQMDAGDPYPAIGYVQQLACGKVSKKGSLPLAIDHRVDIVVGRSGNDDTRVVIMANTGVESSLFRRSEFAVSALLADRPSPRGVAVRDMNADGFSDVLTANGGRIGTLNPDDDWEGFAVLLNRKQ